MAEDRVRCTAPGCKNRILPATAARTGGICRPCENQIAWEEHDAYVRANRREVDRFAGITDPVELIALLAAPKVHDELVIEKPFPGDVGKFVGSLSASDLDRVVALALSYLPEREGEAENIGRWLAAFTTADISALQTAWIESGSHHPGIVFRGAPPSVREQIIQDVKSDDVNLHLVLKALAWIGDARVVELFARWQTKPPEWRSELLTPPEDYARVAGWELDEMNVRRDLFRHTAFALVEARDNAPRSPVEVVTSYGGKCPWCKGPLTTLLELDLEEFSLPEKVVTCASCASFGSQVFMKLSGNGNASWHPRNVKPSYPPAEPGVPFTGTTRLVLGEQRLPLHAADVFLPTTYSQIGGAPGWIQDAEYPHCPDCRRTMGFIGQISPEELQFEWEGLFYAFWCEQCRVTATSHQQT